MPELKELSRHLEQAEKCISCGLCLYSCPVYAEEQNENFVARGRNRLMKEVIDNREDLAARMRDRFSKCLLCRRCTMVCPQGVRTDLLTIAARAELAKDGLPFPKRDIFRKLLKDRNRMKKVMRSLAKFQWLLPVTKGRGNGVHPLPENTPGIWTRDYMIDKGRSDPFSTETEGKIRHIPLFLAGLGGGRQLPSIASAFLSDEVPEINPPPITAVRRNKRVAFFSGCATEFCFPQAGKSLIRVLNQLGIEVVLPKEQGCCGIPVFAGGDFETAREMALHNLHLFLDLNVDLIVTGCATCGSALKEGWASYLAKGEKEQALFEGFGAHVRDFSEFLIELADFRPLHYRSRLPENTRVTYHDPCHLARYQGVVEQPRKILKQVFRGNFIEMDNNGCCGMGGTFSIDYYSLSKKIAEKKVESIARTGADVVITACPGCMIQLIDNLKRRHLAQRVIDIAEAIEPLPVLEDMVVFESLRTKIAI
ncbi:MAG: (Fe-S)-binding protein [Nitrospirae bacterium]|nr:(Fe-S)-binding protein [Nitrospirota bacterium]